MSVENTASGGGPVMRGAKSAPLLSSLVSPIPSCSNSTFRKMTRPRSGLFEESFWTTRLSQDVLGNISFFEEEDGRIISIDELENALDFEAHGTIGSSAMTLILTSVGSGVFALPFVFSLTGAVFGAGIAAVMALLSFLSAYGLTRCAEKVDLYSYEEIAVEAWGPRGAMVMEILILVLLLGAMSALVTLIGDALPAGAQLILPGFEKAEEIRNQALFFVLVFVLIPLSCVKSMSSLSCSNSVGVFCVSGVCGYIIYKGMVENTGGGGVLAFRPAFTDFNNSLQAIPILMLSYCMHVQAPAVYGELKARTVNRFAQSLGIQACACCLIYVTVGIFGLRLFTPGATVPGDVLVGFNPSDRVVLAMRSIVGISCIFVFPLLSLPCRSVIDHLLFQGGGGVNSQRTHIRHTTEAIVVVAVVGLIALAASNLSKVTSVTGATGGALLCYVLPCALFLRIFGNHAPAWERWTFSVALVVTSLLTCLAIFSVIRTLAFGA